MCWKHNTKVSSPRSCTASKHHRYVHTTGWQAKLEGMVGQPGSKVKSRHHATAVDVIWAQGE
ncbi:hypothetical protein M404DRAFT_1000154 [Pisolithus tinctorius Marx 270]|uniref:Uncharacterized protein n=1 Tax=Pisolithus tinctorius Marx 270 TaxID=870435 RepID=A0A0C3PBN3_PISTI|nr:hypothetical protein M404DRAFT_1000154 [Pisolithus tinctorius Marx 270]